MAYTSIYEYMDVCSCDTKPTLFDRITWSWSEFEEKKPTPRYIQLPLAQIESIFQIQKTFNRFCGIKFKIGGSKK